MSKPPQIRIINREFVKIPEAAVILGTCVNQVRNLIDSGNLYAINVSDGHIRRSLRVSVQSIQEFAQRREAV